MYVEVEGRSRPLGSELSCLSPLSPVATLPGKVGPSGSLLEEAGHVGQSGVVFIDHSSFLLCSSLQR